MEAQTILFLILAIITLEFIWEQILDYINLKYQKAELPDKLKGIYNEQNYLKSLSYHKTQTRFSFLTSGLSFLLAFVVISTGFLGTIDEWIRYNFHNEITQALGFFAILFLAADIINLPFQWYSTFVIEEKFGFNKTTYKIFFLDKIKGYLLTFIFGGLILGSLLLLILYIGVGFWIYFWMVIAVFILFINMFYTSLIVPLFNKLTPLEDGELKNSIEEYSQKVKFPLDNVLVINGSIRSSKANAFFSGIGKKKKIILYDTLIENHATQELIAVLAHEVGHYKKKHIISGLILSVLQVGIMLFIMSLIIFNTEVSLALGGVKTTLHLNILAFGILYTPISKITGLFMNVFSRKNEFEADAYATETFDGGALQTALKKLSVENLSNLLPHPWYVFFHYSHPPLMQRLEAIETHKGQSLKIGEPI